eukprot:TRINITY_DN15501_c0_g2_i3.p1 TRINITY_DN15501_c0_g2~~TRINITY_DN15501_c0_g2_i3.p1  ORF type:complete len:453 (+),score=61.68 TRINITY_DN15501_c0_g2_i3:403-1761(+)
MRPMKLLPKGGRHGQACTVFFHPSSCAFIDGCFLSMQGLHAVRNILDYNLKNCANTHVIKWGGKLLALYETGLPYVLDEEDLHTIGAETFQGRLKEGTAASLGLEALDDLLGFGEAVTAHPHVDMKRGRLIIWSQKNLPLDGILKFNVMEWKESWEPAASVSFDMAAGTAPHDFAFTDSFYIWAENRMALNPPELASYIMGQIGPAAGITADSEAPSRIHLVARTGTVGDTHPRHFIVETPPWFSVHHSHAEETKTEDGTSVVSLYSSGWTQEGLSRNGGRFLAAWAGQAPDFDVIPPTHYFRTRIEVRNDGAKLIDHGIFPGLEKICIDHPHVLPADEGSSGGRYAFMTYSNSEGLSSPAIGWLRLNLQTGETVKWQTPRQGGSFSQEPVVVPKDTGDGAWMVGILNDHRKDKSALCIFDGDDFEQGPICRLWLPVRIPHGLHGSFLPADA